MEERYRKFVSECEAVAKSSGRWASFYANSNILVNMLIIIFGCSIGFVNVINSSNAGVISAIMGFGISLMKGMQDMFKLSSKSLQMKASSIKFKRLVRNAERDLLLEDGLNIVELCELYKQKENIEMDVFTLNVTGESRTRSSKNPDIRVEEVTSKRPITPLNLTIPEGAIFKPIRHGQRSKTPMI